MAAYQDPIQYKINTLGTIKPTTREGELYVSRRVEEIQTLINQLRKFANKAPNSTIGQVVLDLAIERQAELDRKVQELG